MMKCTTVYGIGKTRKNALRACTLGLQQEYLQSGQKNENCFDVNWETPSMVLNACGNISVLSRQSSFCTSLSAHLSDALRKNAECSLRCGLCKHGMLPLAESRCVKSPRSHGMPKKPYEAIGHIIKKRPQYTAASTCSACWKINKFKDHSLHPGNTPQRRREPQTSFGLGHLNSKRENTRH